MTQMVISDIDIHDAIVSFRPEETPIFSSSKHRNVRMIQQQTLLDEQTFERVETCQQIFYKSLSVHDINDLINKFIPAGLELKKNIECAIIGNGQIQLGSVDKRRSMAGMRYLMPVHACKKLTPETLTEMHAMTRHEASTLMLAPDMYEQRFADGLEHDKGAIRIVCDPIMGLMDQTRNSGILLDKKDNWNLNILRRFEIFEMAQTGLYMHFVLMCECSWLPSYPRHNLFIDFGSA